MCSCAEALCAPSLPSQTAHQLRLSLLAHVVGTAQVFERAWPITQDLLDLRLARLLKALAVGVLTNDGRMADLEAIAISLLRDHQDFSATPPYVPPWSPSIWDPRFFQELACAQPYAASFWVDAGDIAADSRDELAIRLRRAAQEAGWCCEVSWEEEEDDTQARYAARTALDFMLSVYQKARPALENERLPPVAHDAPLSAIFRGGVPGVLSKKKRSSAERSLATIYEQFTPTRWGDTDVTERVVRAFLRALGLPKEQARALFDAERKRSKRDAQKAPPTPEGEDGN
jgi:hypothetical protein